MVVASCFIVLLMIGMPVVFVLAISGAIYIFLSDVPLVLVPQRMVVGLDNFVLLSVPLFIFAGFLMNGCGITRRLIAFCDALVGTIRGGLAYVNILATVVFSGMTGAATADTAAVGSIMIPSMIRQGYTRAFSAAVTAASSLISPILPPSILAVIYASIAGVSVKDLFLAGILPGLLLAVMQAAMVGYLGRSAVKYPDPHAVFDPVRLGRTLWSALPALMLPVIMKGGMLTGFFTPTEVAAVAVVYSVLLGAFVYRELKLKALWPIMLKTISASCGVLLILAAASIFSWVLAAEGVPQGMARIVSGLTENVFLVLLTVIVCLLLLGTFMDPAAGVIIVTPVLLPLTTQLGMQPEHFGIVVLFSLVVGMVTPPVGVCTFIAAGIAKEEVGRVVIAMLPFLLVSVVTLIIVAGFPALSTTIPDLFK